MKGFLASYLLVDFSLVFQAIVDCGRAETYARPQCLPWNHFFASGGVGTLDPWQSIQLLCAGILKDLAGSTPFVLYWPSFQLFNSSTV